MASAVSRTAREGRPRIAVVRLLPGLGDLLCAVPALRALRRGAPSSEITLVGLERSAWFASRFPTLVDGWLSCSCWPGLPEIDGDRRDTEGFLARAAAHRFDLAIQMHGDGRISNAITAALGATVWVGLARDPSHAAVDRRGTLGEYRADRHEVERCVDVVRLAGFAANGDTALEFPLRPTEVEAAARRLGTDRRYAVVHPGASVAARRWPPPRFAAVVDHLLRRVDTVVLTGGPAERGVTADVARLVDDRDRVVDLADATTVGELAAVLARAVVVVANDTGTVHLSAAVGTPTVSVCGPSDRRRWAPQGEVHRPVGGVPFGRWPDSPEVCDAVDRALGVAVR